MTGLFIGVDGYDNMPPDRQLFAAEAGAVKIGSYFQSASEEGKWEIFPQSSEQMPNRNTIIEAITEWVRAVPPGRSGLLYFAGHGVVIEEGMVLAAKDFHPAYPLDTGIPLRRIFEIIKKIATDASHYVIMLDACRSGGEQFVEELPENVSVVYACKAGGVALESSDTSIYVEGFLTSISACERTFGTNAVRTAKLQTVVDHINETASRTLTPGSQKVTMYGIPDQILLPVRENAIDTHEWSLEGYPQCTLRSRTSSAESLKVLTQTASSCLQAMGIQSQNLNFATSPNFGSLTVEDGGILYVPLPARSVMRAPHAYLEYILMNCGSKFDTLRLDWPGAINKNKLRQLANRFKLDYEDVRDTLDIIRWTDNIYKGRAEVWSLSTGTRVEIYCRSVENHSLGLEYLMTSLRSVYDYLCNIKVAGENRDGC